VGDSTTISWTDATWNVTRGCRRVSTGCGGADGGGCYAERQAIRMSNPGGAYHGLVKSTANGPRWTGETSFDVKALALPLSWRTPRRVFVDSMSDLFYEGFSNEQIAAVFGVMAACPQHTFQCLTKRPKRMHEWFAWVEANNGCNLSRLAFLMGETVKFLTEVPKDHSRGLGTSWPLPNVWLGVSVENQDAADERIPELLATPAVVRFLSCEPLLGPLDLGHAFALGLRTCGHCRYFTNTDEKSCPNDGHLLSADVGIDWVIAGCESGPGARPCDVAWLRSLRDQCSAAGVSYFLKQARETSEIRARPAPLPSSVAVIAAGTGSKRKQRDVIELPYLDGVQHNAMPTVKP
jgi:protein gp37